MIVFARPKKVRAQRRPVEPSIPERSCRPCRLIDLKIDKVPLPRFFGNCMRRDQKLRNFIGGAYPQRDQAFPRLPLSRSRSLRLQCLQRLGFKFTQVLIIRHRHIDKEVTIRFELRGCRSAIPDTLLVLSSEKLQNGEVFGTPNMYRQSTDGMAKAA